jgi:hypothetical protein
MPTFIKEETPTLTSPLRQGQSEVPPRETVADERPALGAKTKRAAPGNPERRPISEPERQNETE